MQDDQKNARTTHTHPFPLGVNSGTRWDKRARVRAFVNIDYLDFKYALCPCNLNFMGSGITTWGRVILYYISGESASSPSRPSLGGWKSTLTWQITRNLVNICPQYLHFSAHQSRTHTQFSTMPFNIRHKMVRCEIKSSDTMDPGLCFFLFHICKFYGGEKGKKLPAPARRESDFMPNVLCPSKGRCVKMFICQPHI